MLKQKLFLLLLLLLKSNSPVEAQTVGVGYYAIQNKTFPCEKALQVYNGIKKPSLMFLWSTFGTNLACVEKFIRLNNRKKEIYIHFSNECCRRNGTCKKGELLRTTNVNDLNKLLEKKDKKTLSAYEKRMEEIIVFIDKMNEISGGNISWFISTGLEDNYTANAAKVVLNNLKKYKKKSNLAKKITIYVNPLNSSCIANRCEIHKKDLGRNNHWLYIPDGYCVKPYDSCNTNVFTEAEGLAKMEAQKKNKNRYFVWWQGQQGRSNENPTKAKPPRKRVITITDTQIKQVNKFIKRGN